MPLHTDNTKINQASINVLGIMSGTSMDGIDLALLSAVSNQTNTGYCIKNLTAPLFVPFPKETQQHIQAALGMTQPNHAVKQAEEMLNKAYIAAVQQWQRRYRQYDLDLIGLHGQTITHRPEVHFTWQLGDGKTLAKAVGIDVVYNFRQQDITAGGEGAPLAPVFHRALSQAGFLPQAPFAVLNVGGVSNISLIGETTLVAFDCGPGNAPMDDLCRLHTQQAYDSDGKIAAEGTVDQGLLHTLMQHAYFARPAPKSLDRDDFTHRAMQNLSLANGLRTLTAFCAEAIAHGVRQHQQQFALQQIAVAGGGRHNPILMHELRTRLAPITVEAIEYFAPLLAGDSIEAWAFAWLALLHQANLPSSFPTTTGVKSPVVAGTKALSQQT